MVNLICKQAKQKKGKKNIVSVDLSKAFDTVNRAKMFEILEARVSNTADAHCLEIIKDWYKGQKVEVGDKAFFPTVGVQQGSVLSP